MRKRCQTHDKSSEVRSERHGNPQRRVDQTSSIIACYRAVAGDRGSVVLAWTLPPGYSPSMNRFAPFAFVLLWSSSFIAARVGLRHLTPLLFVAVRMVIAAAALLAAVLLLRRTWRLPAGQWM